MLLRRYLLLVRQKTKQEEKFIQPEVNIGLVGQ